MSEEPIGCGISWAWMLPQNHVFLGACAKHDLQYDLRAQGELDEDTSYYADVRFYGDMLAIAGDNRWLRLQAWVLYSIARAWGKYRWPKPGGIT